MDEIKLLIVDDEVEFASALAERLELRNYHVDTANSGTEALKGLGSTYFPDIILLDLRMPDMSGFDVLVKIKEKHPAIEVIMLTGHGASSGGSSSLEKGAFAFIMKPVNICDLTKKIQEAYKNRTSAP